MAGVTLMSTGCGPEKKRLRSERDALFGQNLEAQNTIEDLRRSVDALNTENDTLRSDLAGGGPALETTGFEGVDDVTVTQSAGKITLNVPGDLLFLSGKVKLTNASKTTLTQIASIINVEYAGRRIRVEGYTDTDPITRSKWVDNLQLSMERAAAVYRHLEGQGVSPELMYASGFGLQNAKETKKLSRRVEIVVLLADG
ncbi:MAG: OmpA family protein [Algisphaera sp.]